MMKFYFFRLLIITTCITSTHSVHGMYYGLIQEDLEKIKEQEKNEKPEKNRILRWVYGKEREALSVNNRNKNKSIENSFKIN